MRYMIKSLNLSVICILLMAAAVSCIGEKAVPESGYIDVTVVIPDSPKEVIEESRHGALEPGSTDESKITTLTFFVFSGGTLEKYVTVDTSSDPMWDQSKLTFRMLLTLGTKTIYAIANWSLTPTAEMPALGSITTTTALENAVRIHDGVTPSGVAPVMSGKLGITLSGGDQDVKISLTRQIARVDVYPMISDIMAMDATISVEGVRFTNLAKSAYIFARATAASPTGAGTWDQTVYSGGISGNITATTNTSAKFYSTFYIPEYIGSASSATTMFIKAKYNGKDTYYSIPVNGQSGALPSQYAVERNHIYEYYVTIQGIGSETASFSPFDRSAPGVANVKYITEIR